MPMYLDRHLRAAALAAGGWLAIAIPATALAQTPVVAADYIEPPRTPDLELGAQQAEACHECHGVDGIGGPEGQPKLAGQHAAYLEKQLKDFRSGARMSDHMSGARTQDLKDDDIQDLAAWFASRSRYRERRGSPRVALAGKVIYQEGRIEDGIPPCIACHGLHGAGYPDVVEGGYPAIGAQPLGYIEEQLRLFRAGKREADPKGVMQHAARGLTDEDITGLATYVAGLVPPGVLTPEDWEDEGPRRGGARGDRLE